MKNKANGSVDCLVTEMLQCLPTETDRVRGHALVLEGFKGESRAPEARTVLRLVFLKKPHAKREMGLRGFRAIALFECFFFQSGTQRFRWICCVKNRSRLNGGAYTWEPREELTVSICRPWERIYFRDSGNGRRIVGPICSQDFTDTKSVFMAGRETGVRRGQTSGGIRKSHLGHVAAALLAEMQDVRGSACFESSEMEFKYSRCVRQGGVEDSLLWGRAAKYVLSKAQESGRPEVGSIHLSGTEKTQ